MPRSVLVGVVCTSLYGVGALAVLPSVSSRLLRGGSLASSIAVFALAACVVISLSEARGLVQRREVVRRKAFAGGLVLALIWTVFVFTFVIIAVATPARRAAGFEAVGLLLAMMAPWAATAWSLSRPSAKEWFGSGPDGPDAAGR